MSEQNNISNSDKMKWVVLVVASTMFVVSVVASIFGENQDLREITTVFIVVAGLIFGANVASIFLKK